MTFTAFRQTLIFELIGLDLFLRLPFIGEVACNSVTPWCFSPWSKVRR
ncbi:MAG TPA: hypothetical protein PLH11_04170 [Gemmobacter sp.]|nr:hypothetical protein [Gemmobacter sp.]